MAGEGALTVVATLLDVDVGFHQVLIALEAGDVWHSKGLVSRVRGARSSVPLRQSD
jgi:hypothetical protein